MADFSDVDPLWPSRSEEDKAAMRAGALSDAVRKVQRWGLPTHWRTAGPFDWTGCDDVVVMPGRLSGVPTVGHSRFSADNLLHLYELGESARELASSYLLDLSLVVNALAFARSHGIPPNGSEDVFSIQEQLRRDPVSAKLRTHLVDWNGCVAVESAGERFHGMPVLNGTDVPADDVLEDFDEGDAVEEIASRHNVSADLVRDALRFTGREVQLPVAA